MYRVYCRIYQFIFRLAMYLLPWRKPTILNHFTDMAQLFEAKGIKNALLVTDAGLTKLNMHQAVLDALSAKQISCTIYDKTVPNPTIFNIEEALKLYHQNHCNAIIALGGGSPMDCAKGVGARVARPNKPVRKMRGVLKVLKPMPLFVAIPTTAGTGSETTLAAVITDSTTHKKYAINDPALIPHYAVLNPVLTQSLPPAITASTGMDALCHAVEAYIGQSNTKKTKEDALEAVKLIYENLETAYTDGKNLVARQNMQRAAYLAGAAFTRAYVGNVHAMAHAMSALYGLPHGLVIAITLPHVLNAYGDTINKQLSALAQVSGIVGDSDEDKAIAFIALIRIMNQKMGIPDKVEAIKEADLDKLVAHACLEANPLYPVPVIFLEGEMRMMFKKLMKEA